MTATSASATSRGNTGDQRDQRVLGLAPWKPQADSKKKRLLDDVLLVLEEWVGTGVVPSLTTRAILYRLLPLGWEKADDEDLVYVLKRGRRAGLIPFGSVADGRSEEYIPHSWQSPDDFRRAWRVAAELYRRDRLTGQPNVELWVETAGMVEMIEELADELGTPIFTSSGQNTLGLKYRAAQRLIRYQSRGTVIVFVGDLDPYGEVRYRNVREDVIALTEDLTGSAAPVVFVTAALTREQVEVHEIATEPCKPVRRGGKEISHPGGWQVGDPTAQAEALRPDLLLAAIRETVMEHVDEDVLAETLADEAVERSELIAAFGRQAERN